MSLKYFPTNYQAHETPFIKYNCIEIEFQARFMRQFDQGNEFLENNNMFLKERSGERFELSVQPLALTFYFILFYY